jgi:hypothetical protein
MNIYIEKSINTCHGNSKLLHRNLNQSPILLISTFFPKSVVIVLHLKFRATIFLRHIWRSVNNFFVPNNNTTIDFPLRAHLYCRALFSISCERLLNQKKFFYIRIPSTFFTR